MEKHGLPISSKFWVVEVNLVSSELYGSESWVVKGTGKRRLKVLDIEVLKESTRNECPD